MDAWAVELLGWVAGVFTVGVYVMRTMLPLRIMGVLSNVFFVAFGYLADIPPTLFLHLVLLPINLSRLFELFRTYRKVTNLRADEPALDWLEGLEKLRTFDAGQTVFRKGDTADRMYYLKSGTVRIEEIGRDLGPGELFGEVAFFTDDRIRTASASCTTECRIIEVDEKTLMRVFYQSPAFSVFIARLLARRLADATHRVQAAR